MTLADIIMARKIPGAPSLRLSIKAVPGAPATKLIGVMSDGTIKIAVAAAPERNKANEALINFIAAELDMATVHITLDRGTTSRIKTIIITWP